MTALILPPGVFADPLDFEGPNRFKRSQDFGPGISVEPKVKWPGGDGFAKATYAAFHQGVDWFNGRIGDPVRAAAAGIVDFSATEASGSRTIIVNHGRFRTWYAHLNARNVAKGAKVAAGKIIGSVGKTGRATGPHLHFAVEWLDLPGVVLAFGKTIKNGKVVLSGSTWSIDFVDPERRLLRNVTAHPLTLADGVRLRTSPTLADASIYATADAGKITRTDGIVLGTTAEPHPYLGQAAVGAAYTVEVGGKTIKGDTWEALSLDGRTLFIAKPLTERSI